ncbi:26S proteasome non-ATPase regulatory subunit 11 homolog [Prosopis cineraria]|uniref:26S proteasome non-ATPase regulatory subunit 11 homolog n=1 Tax=Prosopis cineraria TaxID=364024 RepID=UPI00240F43F1|nr:26S proteasome non-ATPase regulatory subunit 11 homolog [Prosopis cineraria]
MRLPSRLQEQLQMPFTCPQLNKVQEIYPKATFSLKYMLLCKIMVSQADDIAGIISSKAGLQYVGPDLDAMKAVADAQSKRSLKLFEVKPFSRVEIAHTAELIELPIDRSCGAKVASDDLGKKFAGTLDQGAGCLIMFDDPKTDAIYPTTLETISKMGKVADSLYVRSAKIMARALTSFL